MSKVQDPTPEALLAERSDVARMSGLSVSSVRRAVARGELVACAKTCRGVWLFDLGSVESWIRSRAARAVASAEESRG